MTVDEFSDGFNALLASYSLKPEFGDSVSRQDIVLDEDEKGYFLTVAQDIVIRAAVDKAYNPNRQGADDSYARQADFAGLIQTTDSTTFDRDPLHILTEEFTVGTGDDKVVYAVKPLTYEEYGRHLSKPYQKPLKRQVWRIQTGPNTVAIKPDGITGSYSATYIARPNPICLVDDSPSMTGPSSTLDETEPFHSEILLKAVELAVAAHRGVMVNGGQQR